MRVSAATEPVPGQENEDAVFHHRNVIGVFDGVTRPSGLDTGCIHTITWYVTTLTRSFATAIDATPSASLPSLLATAIQSTNDSHVATCDLTNPSTPAATIAIIRENLDTLDYLVLCDAYLIVDDGTSIDVITDPRFETAVTQIRARHLTSDTIYGTEEHMARFRAVAIEKRRLTNTPSGYWIAAANPSAAYHAITGTLPLKGLRRAALLTDGASRPVDLFKTMTWQQLLALLTSHGPAELIRQIRAAELADSNTPRFKPHDDATAILCQFPPR